MKKNSSRSSLNKISFEDLPQEILENITINLNPRQKSKLKSVSKLMKERLYDIYSHINDNDIDGLEDEIKKLNVDELMEYLKLNKNVTDMTFLKIMKIILDM
jgi:hypothetical protein